LCGAFLVFEFCWFFLHDVIDGCFFDGLPRHVGQVMSMSEPQHDPFTPLMDELSYVAIKHVMTIILLASGRWMGQRAMPCTMYMCVDRSLARFRSSDPGAIERVVAGPYPPGLPHHSTYHA